MLKVNSKAPNFTLENQDGELVSLSDYIGKKIILYFYPKDNTPGCTSQACNFSELKKDFSEQNAVILGVSKDSVKSHQNFINKYNLNFTLLSDPELEVIKLYDVYKEKINFGKKYMGVVRSTYIINEEGIITHAFSKVNAKKNPLEMLELLKW